MVFVSFTRKHVLTHNKQDGVRYHFKNNSLFLDVWHLDLEAVSDDEFRARQKQGEASKLFFLVKANIHVRFSRKFFIFDLRKWEKLG